MDYYELLHRHRCHGYISDGTKKGLCKSCQFTNAIQYFQAPPSNPRQPLNMIQYYLYHFHLAKYTVRRVFFLGGGGGGEFSWMLGFVVIRVKKFVINGSSLNHNSHARVQQWSLVLECKLWYEVTTSINNLGCTSWQTTISLLLEIPKYRHTKSRSD